MDPMNFIPFCFPGVPNVRCAFTGRGFGNVSLDFAAREGDSAARAETLRIRKSITAALGVTAFAEVHQVHGTRTVFEPEAQDAALPAAIDADGLASTRPGLALMVKTADCQPILLAHQSGQYVMALHCGWRGNRQDYPFIAVQEFCDRYGLKASELWAVRGPSLGPSAAEFTNFEQEWGTESAPYFDAQTRSMDLWQLTRAQLCRAGLRPARVLGLDICTYDNADFFFSYRQFRKNGLHDGRQAAFIWKT